MRERIHEADERLRRLLMQSAAPTLHIALAALTILAFAVLLSTRTLVLLEGAGYAQRAATIALLCAPLAVMLLFAVRAARENGLSLLACAAVCAVCALAMLMRLSFIEHVSSDYEIYLSDWLAKLGSLSFSGGMRAGIGEYNVLYQYILFAVTRLPVPPLYAVKTVSLIGDALLAGALSRLCARDRKASVTALCAALLLPSVALNGGMFAQCDSLYAACGLWALFLALDGKPARSAALFALSLAFKLQAAFLLPMVAVLYAMRRLRLTDALVFVGTLILVALPALIGGKPLSAIVGIYTAQTRLYTGLTYNAPTLFGLMNTAGLDVYAYGNFGMALSLGACAALVAYGVQNAREMDEGDAVNLAFVMTLLVVFLLPRMHERYFYLPLALSLAAAVRERRMIPCAALLELAMLATLLDMGLALSACSAMVLLAIVWALLCARRIKKP